MMKMRNTTYNTLNIRGLENYPPPLFCKNLGTASYLNRPPIVALLHQASASCGRVLCVCLFLAMFAFT